MKISKSNLITGSIGVAAAAALLVGNGTFAAWSDSYSSGPSTLGASTLQLNVGHSDSQRIDNLEMYPGSTAEFEFLVVSRDDGSVPAADLKLKLEKIFDREDGCTTASEAVEDGVDNPCTDTAADGDFARHTSVRVVTSQRIAADDLDDACNQTLHPRADVSPANSTLRQLFNASAPMNLLRDGPLAPGEGICVAMAVSLPATAPNAVQGDSASFNAKFDLTQVL